MACGNGVFGVFAARKPKITTPACFWLVLRPESKQPELGSTLLRVPWQGGPGKGRLAVACGSDVFRSFRGQKAQNHHSRASLAWKGKACGWRAGVVFSEFSRPESSKSPLPRVSGLEGGVLWVVCGSGVFGVFTARKLKITTPARLWPGRGRLAGGVREWCFRSFHGQKAQNHHSRASLAWKGEAGG